MPPAAIVNAEVVAPWRPMWLPRAGRLGNWPEPMSPIVLLFIRIRIVLIILHQADAILEKNPVIDNMDRAMIESTCAFDS